MPVRVIGPKDKRTSLPDGAIVVNTTSTSTNWSKWLSPFLLGPCELYGGYVSQNVENAWQFAKVYPHHVDPDGEPTDGYWQWATKGWAAKRAQRYPVGRFQKPAYSLWDGEKFGYVEARKKIYVPLYYKAVVGTKAYAHLRELCDSEAPIYLWDFDGYDHVQLGMSLVDVLNCSDRKMGHAFVLARMLEKGR